MQSPKSTTASADVAERQVADQPQGRLDAARPPRRRPSQRDQSMLPQSAARYAAGHAVERPEDQPAVPQQDRVRPGEDQVEVQAHHRHEDRERRERIDQEPARRRSPSSDSPPCRRRPSRCRARRRAGPSRRAAASRRPAPRPRRSPSPGGTRPATRRTSPTADTGPSTAADRIVPVAWSRQRHRDRLAHDPREPPHRPDVIGVVGDPHRPDRQDQRLPAPAAPAVHS